jgi:hypothetical protein
VQSRATRRLTPPLFAHAARRRAALRLSEAVDPRRLARKELYGACFAPALVSVRAGRRLSVRLLPGDPHALLLEEEVADFRLEFSERWRAPSRVLKRVMVPALPVTPMFLAWRL